MRYTAAAHDVEKTEEEVQLGSLSRNALQRLFAPEQLLDLEGMWQSNERQNEPKRELEAHHDENYVRSEQKQSVQNMRGSSSNKNGEGDDSHFLIRFRVSRVVAVQNRLGVQGQRNCVVDDRPVDVAGLRHVREDHRDRSEDDEDDQIAESNVLESDASRVEERRGQSAEVDERQVFHPRWGQHSQQDEADTTESIQYCT